MISLLPPLILFVCLSVWQLKKLWTDFEEISWRGRDQWVQFWWRSGSPSGSRSPKSAFTGLSKKLPTDFDEILRAGVWPRDQLITFWWWSASLSGSRSPFRITIRFQEELPRCEHTEQMSCKNHLAILLWWHSAEVCALWVLLVDNKVFSSPCFLFVIIIIISSPFVLTQQVL